MAQIVPVDQIVITRDLEDGDDLSGLVKSIQESGLVVPILVDGNNILIDGLRRLEACKRLGWSEVEAVHANFYAVACEYIKRALEHGVEARTLGPKRIWQMYRDLAPTFYATKAAYMTGRRKSNPAKREVGGRPLFAKSIGLKSTAPLQAITQVYRTAESDPRPDYRKRAIEATRMLEEGVITIYGAVDYMKKVHGLSGPVMKYQDQKNILEGAVNSLGGILKGLKELGGLDTKFPQEEAKSYLKELGTLRGQLITFIRKFDEEINK